MASQSPPPSGSRRSRLAASAARVRRRQLALLFALALVCLGAVWALRSLGAGRLLSGEWKRIAARRGLHGGPVDVLLIGLDSSARGARGDLFMVARLDPGLGDVTVISLPSSTQTTLAGYGVGQLAQAPAVGGLRLARSTVQALLGIPIDRAIALDPRAEAALVDAAGGLELDVPSPRHLIAPTTAAPVVVPAGLQRLDGNAAAAYVAAPALPGSLSRARQQQLLLYGLTQQVDSDRGRLAKLQKILLTQATGDLRPAEADQLGAILEARPMVKFATLPGNAGFDGAWIPNPLKVESLIKGISAPPGGPGDRTPMVEILFSPLQEKEASKLANQLTDKGLMVVRTASLPDEEPSSVVSRQPAGRLDPAVRQLMPRSAWFLSDDPSPYSADYTLTIGTTPL